MQRATPPVIMREVQRQPPRPAAARKAAAPEPALQDVKTGTTDAYFAYPAVGSTGTDDPNWYDRTKSRPFASRSLNDLAVSIQQTPPHVGDVECRIPSLAVLRSPPADRSGVRCTTADRGPGHCGTSLWSPLHSVWNFWPGSASVRP